MEPQSDTKAKPSNWEQAKAALVAVFIGSLISIITVLFQYTIEWLRDIPAELPGAGLGIIKYLSWRLLNHHA